MEKKNYTMSQYFIGWKTGPNAETVIELNSLRYDTLEKAKHAFENAVKSSKIWTDDVHEEDLAIYKEVITWEEI